MGYSAFHCCRRGLISPIILSPVSYTHLDVYKRQAVEAEIDFKAINDNHNHYLYIILESLKSISYTYGVKIPMNEALYIYDYINEFLNDSDIAV